MWDDSWTCIGGPEPLVERVLSDPTLGARARRVVIGQDVSA